MATIFFSAKLLKLVGPEKINTEELSFDQATAWNAHLFPVNGRKCIIVTHKTTLYTFVKLDVLKKEMTDLKSFFTTAMFRQLIADQLTDTLFFRLCQESIDNLNFRKTDNDKSVIGVMNDQVYQLQTAIEHNLPALKIINDVTAGTYLNNHPHGIIEFHSPLELVRLI